MQSMYAKLFSRIAQSSLMELDVEVRYCFMMLLAIADVEGDIIGTDVAIARAINLPTETFKRCVEKLMQPDPDSNSPAFEGKRVVQSENGRGYHLVNYTTYRAIKTTEEKRAYMRDYMRKRRKSNAGKDVTLVNSGKEVLGDVTHAEAEEEVEEEPVRKIRVRWFPESLRTDTFKTKWSLWEEHVAEAGKIMTDASRRAQLTDCERHGEFDSIAAINEALRMGWKSIVWDWNRAPNGKQHAPKPHKIITESTEDRLYREAKESGKL